MTIHNELVEKTHYVRIKRVSGDEQRTIEGLVYEPNVLDTYGEMMLADDIAKMAHRFLSQLTLKATIDTNHDETPNGSYPIESFLARKGDPDYAEGAWVLKVRVPEDDVWSRIKNGDLNGFSFQALVYKMAAVVEIEVEVDTFTETEEVEDHKHLLWIELDEDGVVVGGRTSTVNGHAHEVLTGTVTERAFGHVHRFHL